MKKAIAVFCLVAPMWAADAPKPEAKPDLKSKGSEWTELQREKFARIESQKREIAGRHKAEADAATAKEQAPLDLEENALLTDVCANAKIPKDQILAMCNVDFGYKNAKGEVVGWVWSEPRKQAPQQ